MKKVVLFILTVILIFSFTACGKNASATGKWAYNYEPETTVLEVRRNGQAVYNGASYSCKDDGQFLVLSSAGEELHLRYLLKDGDMLLYIPTEYGYSGEGTPKDLTGLWQTGDKKWSFEFTEDGRFSEDGLFSGNFTADKGSSTFTLIYNEDFADTVCYYSINGNTLTVEYPWTMVKGK